MSRKIHPFWVEDDFFSLPQFNIVFRYVVYIAIIPLELSFTQNG